MVGFFGGCFGISVVLLLKPSSSDGIILSCKRIVPLDFAWSVITGNGEVALVTFPSSVSTLLYVLLVSSIVLVLAGDWIRYARVSRCGQRST